MKTVACQSCFQTNCIQSSDCENVNRLKEILQIKVEVDMEFLSSNGKSKVRDVFLIPEQCDLTLLIFHTFPVSLIFLFCHASRHSWHHWWLCFLYFCHFCTYMYAPCQLSQIIPESPGCRPDLLVSHTGHQTSQKLQMKVHARHLSDIFWLIFLVFWGGKLLDPFL